MKLTVSVKHAQRRRQTERSIAELNPSNPKSNLREKECDSPQTETSPDRPPIIDRITIDEILFEPDDDNDDSAEEESDTGFKSKEVGVAGVESDHTSEEPTSRRCTLCLGPRRDQSSLECGHVFCWKCVVGWIREKVRVFFFLFYCYLAQWGVWILLWLSVDNARTFFLGSAWVSIV